MTVTSVRVNIDLDKAKARKESSELLAFASIVLDGVFVVSNIRVIRSETGKIIVSMPSRQGPNGAYRDLAYPIHADFRLIINESVIKATSDALVKAEAKKSA